MPRNVLVVFDDERAAEMATHCQVAKEPFRKGEGAERHESVEKTAKGQHSFAWQQQQLTPAGVDSSI
jgi:hypothetical protein